MVNDFVAEASRLFIFDKPIHCHMCSNDIFIPYETYHNVEKPGIKVIFVHYSAICQQCGFVIEFSDPSGPDEVTGDYRWALDQKFVHERSDEDETVPFLSLDVIEAQKRCIYMSLQLLIHHGDATTDVLTLYKKGAFIDIATFFNPRYESTYNHNVTKDCLVILLNTIMKKEIVDFAECVEAIRSGYGKLEDFLEKSIN